MVQTFIAFFFCAPSADGCLHLRLQDGHGLWCVLLGCNAAVGTLHSFHLAGIPVPRNPLWMSGLADGYLWPSPSRVARASFWFDLSRDTRFWMFGRMQICGRDRIFGSVGELRISQKRRKAQELFPFEGFGRRCWRACRALQGAQI